MISLIIPAYNEEKYILSTLASISKQSYKDVEIILVSDASTDATVRLASPSVDTLLEMKSRKGPAFARNLGARVSKGEVLVFLDADTQLSPGVLSLIAEKTSDHMVGSCKIRPDSSRLKHRFFWSIKNIFCQTFGVSNGIIFCTRKTFFAFDMFPLMKGEDGSFIRKVRREGKYLVLNAYVISSVRRYEQKGYFAIWWFWLKEYFRPSPDVYEAVR